MVLNGAGAYVNLPIGGTIALLQDATFEAWVRWNPTEAQVMARIFDFNDNVRSSMFLTSSNGSMPLFAITTPQGGEELVPANHNPFPAGVLTHVAVALDHTTGLIRLYVNGLEVARSHTELTPAHLGNTANNWLGRSPSTVHPFFKGSISEFRVYRTALSPSRIAANFRAGDAPRELRTSFSRGPANPTNVDTASFIFSANWTDLHSLCSLDEAAFQPCTSPFEIQSLTENLHTFRVQARDVMGNVEASPVTYSWRVDKTPPETSFASAPEPETRLRSPTFRSSPASHAPPSSAASTRRPSANAPLASSFLHWKMASTSSPSGHAMRPAMWTPRPPTMSGRWIPWPPWSPPSRSQLPARSSSPTGLSSPARPSPARP
ncbi:LamG-like jellyroll fold domain-containing protein [Cystobacter fuscus]